ncbi:MAG: hypothetical protein ACMUHX_08310 [bacterium]
MISNRILRNVLLGLIISLTLGLIFSPMAFCQYWTALPPYNTLWPLWSSVLSPVDPTTGLATPIVSSLAPNTLLPVQPAITWDPYMPYPWFLYNSPFGLVFYDIFQGFSMWPPLYLFNPFTLTPAPITLPANYSSLAPISLPFLAQYVPTANSEYISQFGLNAFLLSALQLAP